MEYLSALLIGGIIILGCLSYTKYREPKFPKTISGYYYSHPYKKEPITVYDKYHEIAKKIEQTVGVNLENLDVENFKKITRKLHRDKKFTILYEIYSDAISDPNKDVQILSKVILTENIDFDIDYGTMFKLIILEQTDNVYHIGYIDTQATKMFALKLIF